METKTLKESSEMFLNIANKVRLLGFTFLDSWLVEKILVTVPERFEARNTTLENTKELLKIMLIDFLNSLKDKEQRKLMRQEVKTVGALVSEHLVNKFQKKKTNQEVW